MARSFAAARVIPPMLGCSKTRRLTLAILSAQGRGEPAQPQPARPMRAHPERAGGGPASGAPCEPTRRSRPIGIERPTAGTLLSVRMRPVPWPPGREQPGAPGDGPDGPSGESGASGGPSPWRYVAYGRGWARCALSGHPCPVRRLSSGGQWARQSHAAFSQSLYTARCSSVAVSLRRMRYTFGDASPTVTVTVSSRPRRNRWSDTAVPGG